MSDDCIFCKIAAGEIPARLVHQDEELVAFEDISPKAPVHVVIIPRKHIRTVNDLMPEDAELVGKIVLLAGRLAAARGVAKDGYRVLFNCNPAAGQSVWHIHLHLLGGRVMAWPPG